MNDKKTNQLPEEKSTGRPTQGKKQVIPDDIIEIAEKSKKRVAQNFINFTIKKGWSNVKILEKFYPIMTDESHVSKVLSGVRPVSLALLVVLHYQYDIDLNEFIAGDCKTLKMSRDVEELILDLSDKIRHCRNDKNP